MRAVANPDDLVTTAEAAAIVGKSVPTINRWKAENKLTPFKTVPGGRAGAHLYLRSDVEAMRAEVAS